MSFIIWDKTRRRLSGVKNVKFVQTSFADSFSYLLYLILFMTCVSAFSLKIHFSLWCLH